MIRTAVALVVAAALLAPDPAVAAGGFYDPPAPLPKGHHGDLLRTAPYDDLLAIPGATNTKYLYRQRGVAGKNAGKGVATSAFVAVPEGEAPEGGWPVVAWGHGTTGLADRCAPTRTPSADDAAKHGALLESWVAAGFAVVRTDYEGLGTPGKHPYLNGVSAGRSMLDAVRAARRLDPSIGTDLVLAGHSQGAHAALWAAALAPSYTPELHERGTIAMAPPSQLTTVLEVLRTAGLSGGPSASLAYFLAGTAAADPSLRVKATVLSAKARALWPQLHQRCKPELAATDSFGGLASNRVIARTAKLGKVRRALAANDPRTLDIPAPVLLLQGTADTTVLRAWSDTLADQLAARGDDVDYRTYAGATHASLPEAAGADATAFLTQVLGR